MSRIDLYKMPEGEIKNVRPSFRIHLDKKAQELEIMIRNGETCSYFWMTQAEFQSMAATVQRRLNENVCEGDS